MFLQVLFCNNFYSQLEREISTEDSSKEIAQ